MSIIDKMERKTRFLSKPPLMLILVIAYAAGYAVCRIFPSAKMWLVFWPDMIMQGQLWRLVSFLLVPSSDNIFLILLTCFIYFSIARSLERVIGRWRVNFFLILGIVLLILAGFLYHLVFLKKEAYLLWLYYPLNTYYLYAMLFVLFAMIYPDARFLLMFIIPIRGKWMVFITLGLYALDVISAFAQGAFQYGWFLVFMVAAAILTLVIYLLLSGYRISRHSAPRKNSSVVDMNSYSRSKQQSGQTPAYRHKCAVCGRTDRTNPELDFRYCSKCVGNYEYCQDHLYTHVHVGQNYPES